MKKHISLRSSDLHILAMAFMLCDHSWAMLFTQQRWLTCLGRIAFPIFAFMLVEGFCHTRNLKKYMGRMLVFALLSEIPFDLVYGGTPMYWYHQNVLWTLLLGLALMALIEKSRRKGKRWITALVSITVTAAAYAIGIAAKLDYFGVGIVTILVFYFFRGRKWWCFAGQFICLYYLNMELLGGYYYPITLFGHEFELIEQGLALLALIPIWLYSGEQGCHSKWFRYFCYGFYPGHLLVLYLLWRFL